MSDAYVLIGSNIERDRNYLTAVRHLRAVGRIVAASPVYDTPPIGPDPTAPRFYNGALWIDTDLAPHALRNALRAIEAEMGRVRTEDKDAPRPIDLDLVLYGEVALDDGEFVLPDPHIFERPFMAHALADVNPDYVIPPDGPTLAELACRMRLKPGEVSQAAEMSSRVQELVETSFKERVTMSEQTSSPPRSFGDDPWEEPMPETDRSRYLPEMRVAPDHEIAQQAIADAVRTILLNVGEDPGREGLVRTPERVARAYDELLAGYHVDPTALVNGAFFEADYHDMVVVKDIEFYSLCEHHMLPFFGKVHVAYIPEDKVLGLSKIPRIVEMFARRLQLQERMTQEIADFIQDLLHPRGVAVQVTGQHMCSMMRGVNQSDSKMLTQALLGEFQKRDVREQFNEQLHRRDT